VLAPLLACDPARHRDRQSHARKAHELARAFASLGPVEGCALDAIGEAASISSSTRRRPRRAAKRSRSTTRSSRAALAYDMAYGPAARAFVARARALGARAPTGSACSSSRRRNPSRSGAAGARRRPRPRGAPGRPRVKKAAQVLGWFALAAAGAFIFLQLSYLARIWWMKDHDPEMTSFMEARIEAMRERKPDAKLRHAWVRYDRISSHLKRAIVAAEDARFVDHEGFDWEAIEKAMEKNRRQGKVVMGASTISQQLAKNLFLSAERTPWRKDRKPSSLS
jgi:hypothetical protein